jgi:hypothetical protein
VQVAIEKFIVNQAQEAARGRKREQDFDPGSRKVAKTTASKATASQANEFPLTEDGIQRAMVKEFKGKTYVDLRNYWKVRKLARNLCSLTCAGALVSLPTAVSLQKGEELNPTKKGLMMSQPEWSTLEAALPDLESALLNEDTSFCVNMSELRRATISDLRKSALAVDIREWYKDDSGTLKPGQKGIALLPQAFQVCTKRPHAGVDPVCSTPSVSSRVFSARFLVHRPQAQAPDVSESRKIVFRTCEE